MRGIIKNIKNQASKILAGFLGLILGFLLGLLYVHAVQQSLQEEETNCLPVQYETHTLELEHDNFSKDAFDFEME